MMKPGHRRAPGSYAFIGDGGLLHFRSWKVLLEQLTPDRAVDSLRRIRRISKRIKYLIYNRRLRPYRLQGKKVVHFIHIGKAGGTAIKEALKSISTTDAYRIELHAHSFKLRDVPKGDKVFFFLRDPISRFVSGFYSRKRQGYPKYHVPWSYGEEIAFRQFRTPNDLALALSSEDKSAKESAIRAMKSIAHVRTSYWDWFGSETYFLSRYDDILFIGHQEGLEQDFTLLKHILNLPEYIRLPGDGVQAHRNPDSRKVNLDDEAKDNLINWYAEDYQFIALCEAKEKEAGYEYQT